MKEGKYTKIFAQIQVSAIFHMRDIRRNYVPQIYTMYSLVWKCLVGAHSDGHRQGGQKSTETHVTEFCYKSVIIRQGTQKH